VLECRVCEDVYSLHGDKIPRLLFCGHTLCHACLSRLPTLDGFISVQILIILNPAFFFFEVIKKKENILIVIKKSLRPKNCQYTAVFKAGLGIRITLMLE
jgi:hypothetical protein